MLLALFVFALQSPVQLSPASLADGWRQKQSVQSGTFPAAPEFPVEDDLGRSFLLRANPAGEGVELSLLPISARYLERSPLHKSADHAAAVLDANGQPWTLAASALTERRNLHALSVREETQVSLLLCEPAQERIRRIEVHVDENYRAAVTSIDVFASGTAPGSFAPYWIRANEHGDLAVSTSQGKTTFSGGNAAEPTKLMSEVHAVRRAAKREDWKEEGLAQLLESQRPQVRSAAARHFEDKLSEAGPETMSALIGALKGGGEIYARQLACSLGEIADTPGGIRGLCVLMTRRAKDKWLRLAVRSGLEGEELEMLRVLIGMRSWQQEKPGRFDGTRELAADILHSGRRVEVLQLIDIALHPKRQDWHVQAIAQAFGVAKEADAREALRTIRTANDLASAEFKSSFERGQETYETSCMSCHRPSGYGYELRGPKGRVAEGPEGLKSLQAILSAPKHKGLELPTDLQDLHRYLRLEWQPLKN